MFEEASEKRGQTALNQPAQEDTRESNRNELLRYPDKLRVTIQRKRNHQINRNN